jgi:phosphatidylserine/phosphatidylglycerophosphate/cardiolipin synthase-like enzyme
MRHGGHMKKLRSILFSLFFFLLLCEVHAGDRWWEVFFTDPKAGAAATGPRNPEQGLIRLIDGSRASICAAFYDISSPGVAAAFLRAKQRGVEIRIVTERGCFVRTAINDLIRAGIPVVIDRGRGLMHNKFAVIDGAIVWTGSYNCTENDARSNNNNAMELHSEELAGLYLREFDEMFVDNIFGNRGIGTVLSWLINRHRIVVHDCPMDVYFSPDDDIEEAIVRMIAEARTSIHFMAFSFTSDRIGDAMIERHRSGIRVSGVFEKTGSGTQYSEYMKMRMAGIDVVLDRNVGLMHHKVIIIDGTIVIMGSYNFSKNASRNNDENVLVIHHGEIAREYTAEYLRLTR